MQVLSDPIARFVAVLRSSFEPRFSVACGAVTLEHDGRGEAQKFGLLPEPCGGTVGTPAAGATPANCLGEITWSQEDRTSLFQALGSGIRGSVWDDIVLSELFKMRL